MKVKVLQPFLPILLALLVCSTTAGTASAQGITGVVIFPMTTRGVSLTQEQIRGLRSYLATRLTMAGIGVMPESDFRQLLKDLKIRSWDDCYDDACRIELGKALSADKTLTVEILNEDRRCRITATMYDIRKEVSIAAGDTLVGCSAGELRSGIVEITEQLKQGIYHNLTNQIVPSKGRQTTSHELQNQRRTPRGASGPDSSSSVSDRNFGQTRPTGSTRSVHDEAARILRSIPISSPGNQIPQSVPPLVSTEPSRTKTEWFSIRVNAGGYGGGIEASLFTVRWKYFVWEILRGGGNAEGPGFGTGYDSSGWAAYGGTAFGFPFHIGKNNRHEMRLMTGLFAGAIVQPGEDYDSRDESVGPFVLLEVLYVFHIKRSFGLQTGISVMFPTLVLGGELPDPAMHVFVGLRF